MFSTALCATLQMMVIAPQQTATPDVVMLWNEATLRLIRLEKTPPPLAARNLAMVHIAIDEAVRTSDAPRTATSLVAHRVLIELYPKQRDWLNEAYRRISMAIRDDLPVDWENLQLNVDRVIAARSGDDSVRRSGYRARTGQGFWQPTFPTYAQPLLPGWSAARCFGIRSADQFRPEAPPSIDSIAYRIAFREVKAIGGKDSKFRSDEQTEIAHFWADGAGTVTPPGHWNHIAQTVARERKLSVRENARLFALLNIALADAGIACWDAKFHYELWRPITAIREVEPTWEPLLETPPFPAYTSGHSTFSGAGAYVLKWFFGKDEIRFTSQSDGLPGVQRTFQSFSAAADEAGMSRIYGGIHWGFDNVEGLHCGRMVAEYVCQRFGRDRPLR